MTFHHLNRFKAHSTEKLTPSERLLAWHLSSEIRIRSNNFSSATRTLSETLDIDRRTTQRSLSYLIEKGLFTREKGNRRQADTYRLNVFCPLGCEDFESHNTPAEIKLFEARLAQALYDTPDKVAKMSPQSGKNVAYIEIERRRRESLPEFNGSNELGWIIQTLESLRELNADQFTLKAQTELNPHLIAEIALKITEKLDSDKRKKAYLAKIATQDPNALLTPLEDLLAGLSGEARLQTATRPQAVITSTLKPENRIERVFDYVKEIFPDWTPSELVEPYLLEHADKGTLSGFELTIAQSFEQVLEKTALPLLEPPYRKTSGGVALELRAEGVFSQWLDTAINPLNVLFLLSEKESNELKTRIQGLAKLKQEFIELNPNEDFSPVAFHQDTNTRAFLQLHPEPVSGKELAERFIAYWNGLFKTFEIETRTRWEEYEIPNPISYVSFLEETYTAEDDFKIFLSYFPEREAGSHAKNYRKAFAQWLEARNLFHAKDLESLVNRYADKLENNGGPSYAKLPSNWLSDLIAENQTQKAGF